MCLLLVSLAVLGSAKRSGRGGDPCKSGPEAGLAVSWEAGGPDYAWDEAHTKADYIKKGLFIQHKNAIAGVKIDPRSTPKNTTVYLTVPRWLTGVPSTLNVIRNVDLSDDSTLKNPVLAPWPTWEMQALHTTTGNCDTLQYVQSMEIDANGLMWVIDSGRMNVFEANASLHDNTCPPKILIFDTATGEQVDKPYVIPPTVSDYDQSLLNDIVVDTKANVAYISSVLGTGDIFMYNRTSRESYRFYEKSMNANPSFQWQFEHKYYMNPVWAGAAEDGIALTPDGKWLYYSPLTSPNFWRVRTSDLWTKKSGAAAGVGASIEGPFPKSSTSDGMTFGCDGTLIYGGLTTASVYTFDVSGLPNYDGEKLLVQNETGMNWVDTFAWGPDASIWFTVNQFFELFTSGSQGEIYLYRVPKGRRVRGSYVNGPCPRADLF